MYSYAIKRVSFATAACTSKVSRLASTQLPHPARVPVNPGDDGVAELAVLAPLVERLHHHGLAAGVAAGQQDHNLARLDAAHTTTFVQADTQPHESAASVALVKPGKITWFLGGVIEM